MSDILVPDNIRNEIYSIVGYPLIQKEDLEISSDEDFDNLILIPALREYFMRFPKIYSQDFSIGAGDFILEANSSIKNIFNATAKLNTFSSSTAQGSILHGNVFNRSIVVNQGFSNHIGSVYDYGFKSYQTLRNTEMSSFANMNKMFRYEFDKINKNRVIGYSNIAGKVCVDWCVYSFDFNDIAFELQNTFIIYCQGLLLEKIGMIRGQMRAGQNADFNSELFLTKATELKTQALDRYKNTIYNPPVIRI